MPLIESPTIVGLPLGAEFSIAQRISEEWIKINLPPNKDGIVQSGYVQVSYIQIIDVPENRIETDETKLIQEYEAKKKNINVPSEETFFKWQREYSAAKSRHSIWVGIGIFGGLATIGGVIWIIAVEANPPEEPYLNKHAPDLAWVVAGVGILSLVAGLIGQNSALEYVRTLESEGEAKGYVKFRAGILPTYRSIGFQLAITF